MGRAKKLMATVAGAVLAVCPLGVAPPAQAVVGGQEARPHQYPFMAGLVDVVERRVVCGGALIGDRYVLTAAHCLTGSYSSPARVGVLLGEHDLTTGADSPHAVLVTPDRFLPHPEYDPDTQRNDIALVRLADPVSSTVTSARSACPPRTPTSPSTAPRSRSRAGARPRSAAPPPPSCGPCPSAP